MDQGSFLFSAVVMLGNMVAGAYFPPILRSPINAGVFCMLAGCVIVVVVSLCTKPPCEEYVKKVFSCYDRKVVVSAADAIGEPISEEEIV